MSVVPLVETTRLFDKCSSLRSLYGIELVVRILMGDATIRWTYKENLERRTYEGYFFINTKSLWQIAITDKG